MKWYLKVVVDNYANFSGRARRKEYWMFALFNFIFSFLLSALAIVFRLAHNRTAGMIIGIIYSIYGLAIIIPSLAVTIRRLHDVGKSGWWLLINLVPITGNIFYLINMCTVGESKDNQYGPDPKKEKIAKKSLKIKNVAIFLMISSIFWLLKDLYWIIRSFTGDSWNYYKENPVDLIISILLITLPISFLLLSIALMNSKTNTQIIKSPIPDELK